jgi:hypothetical protein
MRPLRILSTNLRLLLLLLLPLILLGWACSQSPGLNNAAIQTMTSQKMSSPQKAVTGLPYEVQKCLATTERGELLAGTEPSYLLGDFDGDGLTDIAVPIKDLKTRRNGLVICGATGAFILGANQQKERPFSDMPNDNFVSSQWEVFSKKEASQVYKFIKSHRVQVAYPKGDSIAMIWEDGICLIFWEANRYRWGCGE